MMIDTVKDYNIYTINEKRLKRPDFGENLKDMVDITELKELIAATISAQGRVYGINKKKELIGVYIFEKTENYFVTEEGSTVKLGAHEVDFDKFWYGSCTAAFCFKKRICLDELKEYTEQIEKKLKADLTSQIIYGNVAGVEWNDQLMYRKHLKEKQDKGITASIGYISGFALGFIFGWIIFDEWYMGLCFGVSYSMLWGGCGIAIANKSEIDTLNFLNKEPAQNKEVTQNASH